MCSLCMSTVYPNQGEALLFQVIFTNRVAEELAQEHEVVIIRPKVNPKATTIVSKHTKVSCRDISLLTYS